MWAESWYQSKGRTNWPQTTQQLLPLGCKEFLGKLGQSVLFSGDLGTDGGNEKFQLALCKLREHLCLVSALLMVFCFGFFFFSWEENYLELHPALMKTCNPMSWLLLHACKKRAVLWREVCKLLACRILVD